MQVSIDKNDLYDLVKEAVREVLDEKRYELLVKNIDPVSTEEMREIEGNYGKPSTKKEVVYDEIVEI